MKLSIITINKNNAKGLRRTLDSVLSQTYHNIEHVVIDGGSTDESVKVIKDYVNHCIKYDVLWVSELDTGIYNAMNKGLKMCSGEYTLMLNSGDTLHDKNTLNEVFLEEHDEDLFWGKMLFNNDNGINTINFVNDIDLSTFQSFYCTIPHQSCFIKRELIQSEHFYDESYRIVSDHKFLFKAVFVDKRKFGIIDIIVSDMEANGISSNEPLCDAEDDRLFCEFFPKTLLKDYHEWKKLRKKVAELERDMKIYADAITLYKYAKKKVLFRKLYTLLCKIAKK